MQFQFQVTATSPAVSEAAVDSLDRSHGLFLELLREIRDAQREQVALLRQQAASQDVSHRWRAFLDRWQDDFGSLPQACRRVLPHLERAYMTLIAELTQHLEEQGEDTTNNDFALSEFLDRFGVRLSQLGAILSLVGPLAEIAAASERKS
jgi:histidine ammonia-lyase